MGRRKLTYEEVKDYVEENSDCKLLSTEYKDNTTKILFQCGCKEKNKFETSFAKFKSRNKRQCNKCGTKNIREKQNLDYKHVRNFINLTGNKLISKEYVNNSENLIIKCKYCGETYMRTFATFQGIEDNMCKTCSIENVKFTYGEVKDYIENKSECKLISKEYINSYSKLKILCGGCKKHIYMKFRFQNLKDNLRILVRIVLLNQKGKK